MKQKYLHIRLLLLLLIFNLTAGAQNIHVAVNGSDNTGTGSISNPYATITKASSNVSPGDTVFVHAGTYHNANFGDGNIWKVEDLAQIQCNGTPNNYIVFMPFPGDSVMLEFDASTGIKIKNSSYVVVKGFNIKGIADNISFTQLQAAWGIYKDSNGVVHDLAQEMNINIADSNLYGQVLSKPATPNIKRPQYYLGVGMVDLLCHHIIMEDNNISWTPASGLRIQKSDYTTVRNNTISNCTKRSMAGVGALTMAEARVLPQNDTFTGYKIFIVNNCVHHNENQIYSWAPSKSFINFVIDEGSGIFLTRNMDSYTKGYTYIGNNISYLNGASGIVIHKTNRVMVEHNTVYDNGTTNRDAKPGGLGFNTTRNVTFRNNISWSKPNKFALGQVGGNNFNLVVDSNLLFNNNGPEPVAKNVTSGWFEANPQFNNPANFDFRLKANSPAIDRGYTPILTTQDYSGTPRNDGKPDLGAYEFDPSISIEDNIIPDGPAIRLYPNPAGNYVNIVSGNMEIQRLELFDITGKQIHAKAQVISTTHCKLDISKLPAGIYILQVNNKALRIIKYRK